MNLITLDYSTSCTGYARFQSGQLLEHGIVKPSRKGMSNLTYPIRPLVAIIRMAEEVTDYVTQYNPELIIIEEIAGSKNRISQKVLDAGHFFLLKALNDVQLLDRVRYMDVSGAKGWRTFLKIKLSDADKEHNANARKLNKSMAAKHEKVPVVGTKHLSCRYANHHFKLNLDPDENKTDGDIADAICLGAAFLKGLKV